MGLFSFLGGLLGAGAEKKASKNAQAAQLDYLNRALAAQQGQQQQDRTDLSPWRLAGQTALGQQGDLLGLNGAGVQQSAIDSLHTNPLYTSLYRNGLEANLQNASATGGLRGGNEGRSLADFGDDVLGQVYQSQIGNLGQLSGQGLGAASGGVQAGDALTQAISQILGNQGQVTAGGILTRGGINAGIWNNAGAFGDQLAQTIASMFGGGGGFNLSSLSKVF